MGKMKMQQAPAELAVVVTNSKFPLGELMVSPGVYDQYDKKKEFKQFLMESLGRHAAGDWGDAPWNLKEINDANIEQGIGIVESEYVRKPFRKLWITTSTNKKITTIQFASEFRD